MLAKGSTIVLLVLALAVGTSGFGEPEPARAGHTPCGIVTKGDKDFRVYKSFMKCRRAKKGARLFLRQGRALSGFDCRRNVGDAAFACGKGSKTYRAERL